MKDITITEERLSAEEYIEFLKRTDLGSQYPKERFEERIPKLVKNVTISLIARNEKAVPFYRKLGMKSADEVMKYNHIDWTEWTVE